jgi:cell division septation protein DedD
MKIFLSVFLLFVCISSFSETLPSKPNKPTVTFLNPSKAIVKQPQDLMKMNSLPAKLSESMKLSESYIISYDNQQTQKEINFKIKLLQKHGYAAYAKKMNNGKFILQVGPSVFKKNLKAQKIKILQLVKGKGKIIVFKP